MVNPKTEVFRKVVWAVNALQSDDPLFARCAETVRAIAEKANVEIQPAYVLNVGELNLNVDLVPVDLESFRENAQKSLSAALARHNIPNSKEPVVIAEPLGSLAHAATALSNHAISSGAQLIVAGSHGRSGLKRFFLGSFAQELIQHSHVPVLIQGPRARPVAGLKNILFPTDLSLRSRILFKSTVRIAQEFGASITLFHAIPNPTEAVFQSGVQMFGGTWIPIRQYFDEEVDWSRRRAMAWAEWARDQGIDARATVDIQGAHVDQNILRLAREENSDLIVMASETGPIASSLLGSITYEMVREATCPVWVLPRKAPVSYLEIRRAEQKAA